MSLPRFFLETQVLADETDEVFELRLSRKDIKHARVLRLVPGEHVAVVDADADFFECEIVGFGDSMLVRIARHEGAREEGPEVVVLAGLAKGDKTDTVIRHGTELGVSAFVPLLCERSVVRLDEKRTASRLERWRSIAKSAAMQAGRSLIPRVYSPLTCGDANRITADADAVLVCWEEEGCRSVEEALACLPRAADAADRPPRICVVIGPEGGLCETEVRALCSSNPHACTVTLGPSILRAETAGIVAPALVLYEMGGLR